MSLKSIAFYISEKPDRYAVYALSDLHFMDMKKGFSLIELMITLVILGVLAGVAAPGLGNLILDSRLESVAADVRNIFATSRSKSIANGETARIEFTNTSLTTCITDDISQACSERPEDDVLSELNWASEQITVGRNSALETPILIDPRGRIRPTQNVIDITFCDERGIDYGLILNVNQVGRTTLGKISNKEGKQCL